MSDPTRKDPSSDSEDVVRRRIELEILKESLSHRSDGAKISVIGMLIAVGPFVVVIRNLVPTLNLAIWVLPVIALMIWRVGVAAATKRALARNDEASLVRFDKVFRSTSVLSQFWLGTGVWTVGGRGTEVDLYVTLAVCIFGTGAAISLAHDAKSVLISMPLLFGQCILFWLLKGLEGYHIAVLLIPVMLLAIYSAKRSESKLNETIAIRFENDALLRRIAEERESALAAAARAEEANHSKSVFMAAASHDLRQPLYAISLLADTLALQDLPEGARAIVEQQSRSLEALRQMFDNLLDLSRFDSGDVHPHIEPVFLPEIIAELLDEFHPLAESKGLTLDVEPADEYVDTDSGLLSRLLRNLVSNAIRYTKDGTVLVRSRRDGDFVVVEVVDTGCGIDPIDQPRIFGEFVQLSNPERNREKGVGLGLSIVRRISDLLGHDLYLSSDPGRGTTVGVRIHRTAEQPATRSEPEIMAIASETLPEDTYLWIVEDDQLVRDALATHLIARSIRHDFAVQRSELEALAAAHGWPDFVLLDDMLGRNETGLDLARWLSQELPKERILLMTGNTDPERYRTLRESGFEVVRKPLSSEELMRFLGRARAQRTVPSNQSELSGL